MATDRYDAIAVGFDPSALRGSAMADGTRVAYASRRTGLDELLTDAPGKAGADAREGFTFIDDQTFSHRRVAARGVRQKVADSLSTTGYPVTA